MKKLFLLFTLICIFATACEDDGVNEPTNTPTETPDDGNDEMPDDGNDEMPDDGNDDTEKPVFEINGDGNYIVEAVGGTVAVKVTTNLEYDVVIDEDAQSWLSVADTRAVREVILIFTVAENESFDERSATVELKGADGKVLQSVSFKQKGVEEVFDTDSEGNYIVEADGGTVAVKVTTNLEYDVVIDEDAQSWLSVAVTRAVREEILTLNVAKNEGSEKRSATVNLCAKGGDILQTITIKQSCANNEIIYTTKYGYPIELNTTVGFGGNIMSHNYANGYGRIIFDNDVVSIPNVAFKDCTTLTTIVLPNSLSTIGSSVFRDCTSLTSITIPDSVTSIGTSAFYGCSSLTSVTIPDGVTTIGDHAFCDCTSLTSVTIPDGVTTIRDRAFYGCSSLTSVTIGDGVTTIGVYAFFDCSSLTSVTIPDGVTTIGNYAFWYCDSLTSVTIGDGVTTIGEGAFSGCVGLESLTIGKNVKEIGRNVFYDCRGELFVNCNIPGTDYRAFGEEGIFYGSRFDKITFGDNVTSIGKYAFRFYDKSTTIIVIGKGVKEIGSQAFRQCQGELIVNCSNIPEHAFESSSFSTVTINDSVITIGDYAFDSCDMTSITIPFGVTKIGNRAFQYCTNLTTVTISDSVTSIGSYAFSHCDSLMEVYCKPITPPMGGDWMFPSNNALYLRIYVPSNSVSAYKSASYWWDYKKHIFAYDFE